MTVIINNGLVMLTHNSIFKKIFMQTIGLIVGKFYPLHQGHINMILSAKMQVDLLHIYVCSETDRDHALFQESAFTKAPTSTDRVEWANAILKDIPGIIIHGFNEDGIPAYPNGWQAWSDRLRNSLRAKKIQPTLIFSSEPQDKAFYEEYFNIAVQLVDPPRNAFPVSATKIRTTPFQYWEFIPSMIRPFFTRVILVESQSASDIFVHALTKLYTSVEIDNYAKIHFHPINHDNIEEILDQYSQEQRTITGMIASPKMISICKDLFNLRQLEMPSLLTLNQDSSEAYDAKLCIAQFKESQIFINKILSEK